MFNKRIIQMLKSKLDAYSVERGDCIECTYAGSRGYSNIVIVKDGKAYKILAHRLAYYLAYGELKPDLHVCHICDNKKCIKPEHLFQGTQRDNMLDKKAKNRHRAGLFHPRAKLKYSDIEKIRELAGTTTQKEIAKKFNIVQSHVSAIIRGVKHATASAADSCQHNFIIKVNKNSEEINLSSAFCTGCGVKLAPLGWKAVE